MLKESFESFVDQLAVDNEDDMFDRYKRILKKLNKSFWGEESEEEHGYIVGSLGRKTAIKGVSDMDMLFVLPSDLKAEYDKLEGNKQKKLLQDVKKEIKEIYPKTIVRGDGQVVVVSMTSVKCEIEVCPVFERGDGAFDYPDANNGGRWRKTDPLPELAESEIMTNDSNGHFIYISQMIRAWKNHKGFKFGGLLIDTLVYNFLKDSDYEKYKSSSFESYLPLFIDLFGYLKDKKKEQKYWLALGSNQQVYNKGGAFVSRAKKAYEKLKDLTEDSDGLYDALQDVFGKDFPIPETVSETYSIQKSLELGSVRDTEEFVEDKFTVDIRYQLKIDCFVDAPGFQRMTLRGMLAKYDRLKPKRKLTFYIVENEFDDLLERANDPNYGRYTVYWKVLNRGPEAIRRNMIRGQIRIGSQERSETSNFRGEHIVECYIVHNEVVVARDRIRVPIESNG